MKTGVSPSQGRGSRIKFRKSLEELAKSERFIVDVSPLVFRLSWVAFLIFHAACALYLVLSAYVYHELPTTVLAVTLENNGVTMSAKHYPFISNVMALLAALHGIVFVTMIGFSLHARCFTYFYISSKRLTTDNLEQKTGSTTLAANVEATIFPPRSVLARTKHFLTESFLALFGRGGFFDIEGHHFITLFLFREVVEVALQAQQAYRLAAYVPRPGLVRSFVALLVISCWSTPLIHRMFQRRPGLDRMSCLVLDVTLDFVSAIVIPVVLVSGYVSQYDPVFTNFPIPSYRQSLWRALMMNEFRLIMVSSWIDLFARVTMSVGTVSVLFDVKKLLRMKTTKPKCVVTRRVERTREGDDAFDNVNNGSSGHVPVKAPPVSANAAFSFDLLPSNSVFERRLHTALQVLIAVFGLIVLGLHLATESLGQSVGCVLPVVPWGATKPGCAYTAINCSSIGITGTQHEMASVFDEMDTTSLQSMDIFACLKLQVPPSIKEFHHLASLKIISSSIDAWNEDAALTATDHPFINYFVVNHVQIANTELPPGLYHDPFPPGLRTIYFNDTNLASLPDTLARIWPKGLIFIIEYSKISVFPEVVTSFYAPIVSLAGNQIQELPVALMYTPLLQFMDMSGNPITEFPTIPETMMTSKGEPGPNLVLVDMTATALVKAPAWLKGRAIKFIATNTPLCDRILAKSALKADEQYLITAVDCTTWTMVGYGY